MKLIPHRLKVVFKMIKNYWVDFFLYAKYSTVLSVNSFENKEAKLILHYHGIEKGLLFSPMKERFGKDRIIALHPLLNDKDILNKSNYSQIYIAYKVVVEYYEIHLEKNIDISDYFTIKQYQLYKSIINKDISFESGRVDYSIEDLYKKKFDFYEFAKSRKSIRQFSNVKIPYETILKVIDLANTSPSVCNRQAAKVKLIEDKNKIQEILKIQGGFNGFIESVNQLLILTIDRQYFYTVGERNQFYIDGGIYLMNLLYSLHFYEIAACPANWGKDIESENELNKIIQIPKSEKIMCLIPIGRANATIATTLSYRRSAEEVLTVIG